MPNTGGLIWTRMAQTFHDKEYRQVYTEAHGDTKLATQIKVLREQRGWTQQQLADAAGMTRARARPKGGQRHCLPSFCS